MTSPSAMGVSGGWEEEEERGEDRARHLSPPAATCQSSWHREGQTLSQNHMCDSGCQTGGGILRGGGERVREEPSERGKTEIRCKQSRREGHGIKKEWIFDITSPTRYRKTQSPQKKSRKRKKQRKKEKRDSLLASTKQVSTMRWDMHEVGEHDSAAQATVRAALTRPLLFISGPSYAIHSKLPSRSGIHNDGHFQRSGEAKLEQIAFLNNQKCAQWYRGTSLRQANARPRQTNTKIASNRIALVSSGNVWMIPDRRVTGNTVH